MIKAQRDLYGEITNISLRQELDQWTFYHPSLGDGNAIDYGKFIRSEHFWLDGVSYTVREFKKSKWYKKQPHYRPTGKSTYELIITTWDENGQNPVYQNADFESLSQIEKQLKG